MDKLRSMFCPLLFVMLLAGCPAPPPPPPAAAKPFPTHTAYTSGSLRPMHLSLSSLVH